MVDLRLPARAREARAQAMSETPAFVLVRPQMGENIGAAARAMLNFGLVDMERIEVVKGAAGVEYGLDGHAKWKLIDTRAFTIAADTEQFGAGRALGPGGLEPVRAGYRDLRGLYQRLDVVYHRRPAPVTVSHRIGRSHPRDAAFALEAASPTIVFHKQIQQAPVSDDKTPVLVGQNFFRHGDRYVQVDGEQRDKYVTEEFLPGVVHGCQLARRGDVAVDPLDADRVTLVGSRIPDSIMSAYSPVAAL